MSKRQQKLQHHHHHQQQDDLPPGEERQQDQGNLTEKGKLCTVDLHVLISLELRLLILQSLFTFFTKQAFLMRRSTVLSFPFQLVFPGKKVDNTVCFYRRFVRVDNRYERAQWNTSKEESLTTKCDFKNCVKSINLGQKC